MDRAVLYRHSQAGPRNAMNIQPVGVLRDGEEECGHELFHDLTMKGKT